MLDFLMILTAVIVGDIAAGLLKVRFPFLVGTKPAKVRKTRGPNKPKLVAPALATE